MNPRAMFAAKPLSTTTCKKQVVVLSGLVEAGGWDQQAAEGSLDACLLEAFRNIAFWVKCTHTRL